MVGLAILFGGVVGFALGLTGGGGGIFAVPLLVYGLGLPARAAVGVSLAAVGGTALFGAAPRVVRGEAELGVGALFAVAGMCGAPVGNLLAGYLPEPLLLACFAVLMLLVAARMWAASRVQRAALLESHAVQLDGEGEKTPAPPAASGRRWGLLAGVGLGTGVLSGLFGVGGGFVIVPALVLLGGMDMHRAVPTSLLAIFFISVSGVVAYVASGGQLDLSVAAQFLVGGFVGMGLGAKVARGLDNALLQRIFAAAMVLVAAFMIFKSMAS